jgi:hypothetical protein
MQTCSNELLYDEDVVENLYVDREIFLKLTFSAPTEKCEHRFFLKKTDQRCWLDLPRGEVDYGDSMLMIQLQINTIRPCNRYTIALLVINQAQLD